MSSLDEARKLDAWGLNVLPARVREKSPQMEWKKWAKDRTSSMLSSWFNSRPSNFWVATGGVSGVYVLDIDNDAAEQWWRDVAGLGPLMDTTPCVRTSKGHHYWFSVPADDTTTSWAVHDDMRGIDFDVRGVGGGVVAPPSIHETGVVYEWIRSPDDVDFVPAPEWIKSKAALWSHLGLAGEDQGLVEDNKTRSMLSSLLAKPPKEGGRNDWLARVAGHYAKAHRQQQDLYMVQCGLANKMLAEPLGKAEFDKTIVSIWNSEQANHDERGMDADSGWLMGSGDRILTQIKEGKGDGATYSVEEFANFDLKVHGVIKTDEGNLVYDCTMTKKLNRTEIPVILAGKACNNATQLASWLGGYGVSIARPENTYPASPGDHTRLLRYLTSQNAPESRMSPSLGYDEESGGFLTFDGVITKNGLQPFAGVRPDPTLRSFGLISHEYGFEGGVLKARAILSEVLTYHEEQVVAVFGAWWAACLLKSQLQAQTSLFPILAVEAASGAGKTNGFFELMLQLNGNVQGATQSTLAAGRDKMGAHKSGIVWIDDLDVLGKIEELLRAATSNETLVKKGFDNSSNVSIPLVAPVVVSGEQLGLGSQKALMDRVVTIEPGRPDGRRSQKPGREDLPQWEDIVELTANHPLSQGGLAVVAGTLVSMALALQDRAVARLKTAKRELREMSGRQAEKVAILVAGAYVLDRLVGDLDDDEVGVQEQRVREWGSTAAASNHSGGDWDNRLTTEILPWALRSLQWPTTSLDHTPAWVEEDAIGTTVWVNCPALADAWREHMRGQIVQRTDTRQAILAQLQRCGVGEAKSFDVVPGRRNRQQAKYWAVTGEVAEAVLSRSQG